MLQFRKYLAALGHGGLRIEVNPAVCVCVLLCGGVRSACQSVWQAEELTILFEDGGKIIITTQYTRTRPYQPSVPTLTSGYTSICNLLLCHSTVLLSVAHRKYLVGIRTLHSIIGGPSSESEF